MGVAALLAALAPYHLVFLDRQSLRYYHPPVSALGRFPLFSECV
jgi:hypothetical protein